MNSSLAAIVYVTYEGEPSSRFDRRYYVEQHLPLVMQAWQAHGLESVRAFFPEPTRAGTLAICECRFRDEQSIADAFGSTEAMTVMADLSQFTDLPPARLRAMPMVAAPQIPMKDLIRNDFKMGEESCISGK